MKRFFLIISILAISAPLFARDFRMPGESGDFVPEPVLLYPKAEEVDLIEKDSLEFKWSPHEGVRGNREYYDFRLYKGYNTIESALMLKEQLPGDIYQYNVNAGKFEDEQIYTWSLGQVYSGIGIQKSRRAYISFKVIKTAPVQASEEE